MCDPIPVEVIWHDACGHAGYVEFPLDARGVKLSYIGYLIDINERFVTLVAEYAVGCPESCRDRGDIPLGTVLEIRHLRTKKIIYQTEEIPCVEVNGPKQCTTLPKKGSSSAPRKTRTMPTRNPRLGGRNGN